MSSELRGPDSLVEAPHVLREYAFLADGERGILVGPRGDFAWMCFPRWHDDAVFAALIGGSGAFSVTPVARAVWGGYYESGTLIWRSRWITDESIVECREALALPTSDRRAVVLRRVHAIADTARVEVRLGLRADFGRYSARSLRKDDGCWRARVGESHALVAGLAAAEARPDGEGGRELVASLTVEEGETHDLMLTLDADEAPPMPDDVAALWEETETAWRERVPKFADLRASDDSRHAYAVMTGMTSAGGGMVAAATTSLPERAREGRNFDYRYVWIRDQCYAGQAAAHAGGHRLLDDAVRFVGDRLRADEARLRPAYTVAGEDVPQEEKLDLSGYPGGTDIVGNWVRDQFQLDAFGEALLLFAAAARVDRLEAEGWRAVEIAAESIAKRWREADAGIWELDPAEWTHGRLICAAGLRAISELPAAHERAPDWLAMADRLVSDCATRCVHPTGRWQRGPEDERVDAALLLAAIRGAVPADDPRSIATLRAVEAELTQQGYAYRYRPDARPLGEAEGAFLICGFWMSLALAQQGEYVEAARWFERSRAACGPPGLFSEEFDVRQRQLRGNLPQAFVHALFLECAADHASWAEGDGPATD